MRSAAMQLTLAFLDVPTPTPSPPSRELGDVKASAEALDILARLIAKAAQATSQTEATDE
jgi:hypothetical protein